MKLRRWSNFSLWIYLCLCFRFDYAAFSENAEPVAILLMLFCVGLGLSLLFSEAALFGVTAALPLFLGLNEVGLITGLNAPIFLLSTLSIGWYLKRIVQAKCPLRHDYTTRFILLAADIMAAAIAISLVAELTLKRSADLTRHLLNQSMYGYSDQYYFLTSAFLWLQGIYYFKELVAVGGRLRAWVAPILIIYSLTAIVFMSLQLWIGIPIPLSGYAFYAPFDDISSFGSIMSCLFVFTTVTLRPTFTIRGVIRAVLILSQMVMIVLSWSRAAWLSSVVFLLIVAYISVPLRWNVVFCLMAGVGVLLINLNAQNPKWSGNHYLNRLVALARIENPKNKSPERMMLYRRAVRMIKERPWTGHGIGSFYLKSTSYTSPRDPRRSVPDFAHNLILQVAAELGIPIALLFTAMIIAILFRGIKSICRNKGNRTILSGSTLAFACYLLTQMTANSLNVYISNQVVFSLLAAAVIALAPRGREEIAANEG